MDPLALFLAAVIAAYILTVKLCQEIGYAHDERVACKHPETTLSVTQSGSVRVDCQSCHEYLGEWRNVATKSDA